MAYIAEDLKANLISSVVSDWETNCNGETIEEGKEDINTILSCIAAVRKKAQMALYNCNPIDLMQLDVAMIFALSSVLRDLKNDEGVKICDLPNQAREDFVVR